jgi:hypothetical protein
MSALSMAEQASPKSKKPSSASPSLAGEDAAGAPIPRDAIDPELIKLRRPPAKIGMVTSAGIILLCAVFWFRLGADRRFGGSAATPTPVAIGDVLAGKVATEQLISVTAEPLMAHAVLATTRKGASGLRVVPARGTGDRLWLVISGDGNDAAISEAPQYAGRLRPLSAMPFAKDIGTYLASHPRPVFAPPAAVRAAIATGKLRTVTGDELTLRDSDELSVDVIDLGASTLAATLNERFPDAKAWVDGLAAAGLTATPLPAPQTTAEVVRFSLAVPVTTAAAQLEKAGLWAARVEPVLRSHRGTWAQLKASPPSALTIGEATVPDEQIDLVGAFVERDLPDEAYALVTSEAPADYWYVRPISIALLVLAALFTWVLVRAIRRDLLPPRAA